MRVQNIHAGDIRHINHFFWIIPVKAQPLNLAVRALWGVSMLE